jgi:dihydrofolate reductase
MKPEVILITAMDRNNAIGKNGDIPWRGKLPADMAHFQVLTMGGVVVMGRLTWESIPPKYRPLAGRANVVLTRDENYHATGVHTARNIESAIAHAGGERIWVIGGEEVYRQFLPIADRLELTMVDTVSDGDKYFPHIDESEWSTVRVEPHEPETQNHFPYTFRSLIRRH